MFLSRLRRASRPAADTQPDPNGNRAPSPAGSALGLVRPHEGLLAILGLLVAVIFNLYHLSSTVTLAVPPINDGVLHLAALRATAAALAAGADPTDPWLPGIALGFPLFHHYQHLAYLPPAVLSVLFDGRLPLPDIYRWTTYLLLSLFPLSVYWSMRRFGFSPLPSSLSALAAPLLATNGQFGFDFGSYVWRGAGLYTQLWGMVLLPVALAQGHTTLRLGRGYVWSVLLLAATLLSHLVMGYIALLSLAFIALLPLAAARPAQVLRSTLVPRALRLFLILGLVALVAAYFLVPFVADADYMNRSVWENRTKYDSVGHTAVLTALVRGDLFDFGRLPILTVLGALGLILCLRRWRDERFRIPVALFIVWLLLYFGRPTWGPLLDLLPLSRDLHLHRLIAGVHLGGIYLIGLGLSLLWQWGLAQRRRVLGLAAPLALTALLLYPALQERADYLVDDERLRLDTQRALAAQQRDLTALTDWLRAAPPGRVYAGLGAQWGRDYRVGAVPVYALLQSADLDMVGYLYHALALSSDIMVLFDERRADHYALFNVRYVVAPRERVFPDFVRPVRAFGRHQLYQVATSGYFDLVDTPTGFAGSKHDLFPAASAWLHSDLPRIKHLPRLNLGSRPDFRDTFPLTDAPVTYPAGPQPDPPARGRVLAERVRRDRYEADVQVDRPGQVILKTTFHPNWRAYVDGREVAPHMVMPGFPAVPVAPGRHQVRLDYDPGPQRGLLLLFGLLVLATLGLAETRIAQWVLPAVDTLRRRLPGLPRPIPRPIGLPWTLRPAASPILVPRPSSLLALRARLGLYLVLLAVYLLSAPGHFISVDHIHVYLTAESLVERGTLAIKPLLNGVPGPQGLAYSPYAPAQSILSIPLYLLGAWVDDLSPDGLRRYLAGPNLRDWGGTVPIFFVSLFNQLITPLIAILAALFCVQMGQSRAAAIGTSLILGLGTLLWVMAREYFQHPLETLALLAAVYVLFANRLDVQPRHALAAGSALALGVLTRTNLILVTPAVLAYLCFLIPTPPAGRASAFLTPDRRLYLTAAALTRQGPERLRSILAPRLAYITAYSLPLLAAIACLLYLNWVRSGYPLNFGPQVAPGFSTPFWDGLFGYLVSPGRSIILYSPPLLLAPLAFRVLWREHRPEYLLFTVLAAIYLLVFATYQHWHGGWSYGPRYLTPLLPFLVIPLSYLFRSRRTTVALALLTASGVLIQILGVTVNYSYVYWDWLGMKLVPEDAYLYIPRVSAIPTHASNLLAGRHIDLWLVWVYRQYGAAIALLTAAGPLSLMVLGLWLLRSRRAQPDHHKR